MDPLSDLTILHNPDENEIKKEPSTSLLKTEQNTKKEGSNKNIPSYIFLGIFKKLFCCRCLPCLKVHENLITFDLLIYRQKIDF